jgi:hypothetical protein
MQRDTAGLADFLLKEFGGAPNAAVHLGAIPNRALCPRHLQQRPGHDARDNQEHCRRDQGLGKRKSRFARSPSHGGSKREGL